MERRLAAVLMADVVGYSRLMGLNEAGTLSTLKTHRRELVEWLGSAWLFQRAAREQSRAGAAP